MVVRIVHSHIDPASLDEAQGEITRRVTELIIPALRQLQGFLDDTGGVNRETGHLVALTRWETAEQASGAGEAMRAVLGSFSSTGVVLEPPEIYESTIQS